MKAWEACFAITRDAEMMLLHWERQRDHRDTWLEINAASRTLRTELDTLRKMPNSREAVSLAYDLCLSASGSKTNSVTVLAKRIEDLRMAVRIVHIYRLAFVGGQDNPSM